MKYGTAIGKKMIAISELDFNTLMGAMTKFANENSLKLNYEQKQEKYFLHDEDGFNHFFTFEPAKWNDETTVNLMGVSHKTKTLRIFSPFTPSLIVSLSHNHSQLEGTDTYVDQYNFYVYTTALQEREYRRKNWETFSGYKSFDYDTDIDEIIKSIISSLTYIVDAYRPLFA